jgi:low affinity Fe/Cu permease
MEYFSTIAKWISDKSAQSYVSFVVLLIIFVWAIAGLPLHFSVIWYLLIDTSSAVISIIMLFIIQNSQNRHTIAIQLKLDEIIRATKGAHNEMMDIEKLTDEDLAKIQKRYGLLAEKTKEDLKKGKLDTHSPDIGRAIELEVQLL